MSPDTVPTDAPGSATPTGLREPAHQVSSRAVKYWVVNGLISGIIIWVVLFAIYLLIPDSWGRWAGPVIILILAANLSDVTLEPIIRYRRTRWEVTDERVFVQTGWLSRDQRIAPLSRVQTVDTHRGAIMRLFGLANVTVTTASAAGPITLPCLDSDVADRITAELARVTGQTEGDAT
ncbi:PH domain-containing protein [Ornithinimicrobium pratense]|uniref:PH domain-containing protein n=1 Tax=Ornithinimicrobium pratense TaxID=2593973 RepID=A0A5J6V3G0_9MICO|nr:PH domain-containing protein [Ornithinimicrobium pratense]QFG67712.1 PH domain-containing protein [Ornithinimicrobium pratense]